MCIHDQKAVLQSKNQEQCQTAAIADKNQEPKREANGEQCEVSVKVDARLLSFLERDRSFLTPWSWDPVDRDCSYDPAIAMAITDNKTQPQKQYMQFQTGSFFSYNNVSGSKHQGSKLKNPNQAVMKGILDKN